MEYQIVTVADLVGATIAEMERRNCKPSVIKQYGHRRGTRKCRGIRSL
jgi:hypothetical protein